MYKRSETCIFNLLSRLILTVIIFPQINEVAEAMFIFPMKLLLIEPNVAMSRYTIA